VKAGAGNFAFNGAISPTTTGNGAAIDYNVGGSTKEVELRAQSRGPAMPAGTMSGEAKLAESAGIDKDFSCPSVGIFPSSSCRWGDYAGASPDPVSANVVWGTGEVNGPIAAENEAQWKTENFALALHAAPTAEFSITTASPTAGTPVSFDASASSDSAEALTTYEWSFGDGAGGSGEKPSHTYGGPGKYTVRLTVADAAGFRSSVEHEVTVAVAPPPPTKTSGTTGEETGKGGTPSNVVHVTGVKHNKKKGTAAVSVSVPGAGVLSARETSSAHSSLVAPLAGALGAPAAYPVALIAVAKGKTKAKGPFVKAVTIAVSAAGKVTIQIAPNAAGSALLKSKHKLTVKILIAFTPTGGTQGTLVKPVTLVLSPAKKRK
jgi:PKD repeat protein